MKSNMVKNYAEADRIRKQREREEVVERDRRLREASETAIQRARKAESQYRDLLHHARVLPDEILNRFLAQMLSRIAEDYIGREHVEPLVMAFLKNTIIRIDKYRSPMGIEIELRNDTPDGETYMSVVVPEMRLTQILNQNLADTLTRGRGPVVMEDRKIPIVTMEESPSYERVEEGPLEIKEVYL